MKDLLQKKRILFLCMVLLLWSMAPNGIAQTIEIPPDITLDCGDLIPEPHAGQVIINDPVCLENAEDETYCGNMPLTPLDGCYVNTEECVQIALVCIDYDSDGYPIYKFKVYNNCDKDLSNIAFPIPIRGNVQVPSNPFKTDFSNPRMGIKFQACDEEFKVEAPRSGPDASTVKFEGQLAPGKSALFVYKVLFTDLQEEIRVNPKIGPTDYYVDIEVEDCDEEIEVKKIQIEEEESGDVCSGKIIKHIYTVYFTGDYEPMEFIRTITVTGSDQALTGICPEGKSNLSRLDQVPDGNSYKQKVKEAYSNNCGKVEVSFIDQQEIPTGCGGYQVEQHFKIENDCGYSTTCKVVHTVKGNEEGDLSWLCPQGSNDLMCESEAPSPEDLKWQIKEAYDGELYITVATQKSGNNCSGFWIKYHITIKNECGKVTHCSVVYEGKDETAPTGPCPPTASNLQTDSDYIWYFKENWTDNCGDGVHHVEKRSEIKEEGDCGSYTIIKKFAISDKCGNTAYCEVSHTGEGNAGELIGECPDEQYGLQCLSEVPTKAEVIELVKGSFENEKSVQIWTVDKDGDDCAFTVKFKVMITGYCGDTKQCWVVYKGGDTTKPSGPCPPDAANLDSDYDYIWYFKETWTDNCGGGLTVKKVNETKTEGYCNSWTITKKFSITDKCGNTAYCEVSKTGGDGGELIGECPDGEHDLQCLSEVPTKAEVIELVKGSFENEKTVQIWTVDKDGDDCAFTVKFKVMVTGYCGDTKQCWVVYKGGDTTKPAGPCPPDAANLDSDYDYIWYFKETWTDNCGGGLTVKKVNEAKTEGYCNSWTVTKKFSITDKCGNTAYCEVSKTGGGGDELIGECPDGKYDLQCLDEVPTKAEVIELVKESFENEKNVQIWSVNKYGDECDGFTVKFKVMVTGYCGESKQCWIEYKGKDTTAPTGTCPTDVAGLSTDYEYIWFFKENWTDNCGGDLIVKKVSEVKEDGYCNTWTITKKFAIIDQCGNTTYCEVAHSGGGGGNLIGECPDGEYDLQCLDEVPTKSEVIALVKQSFENEKSVQIWTVNKYGDECDGFTVKFKVMVTGYCGESKQCWIEYKGKDTTAPTGVCPPGKTGLTSKSQVPDPSFYLWKIKNAYTDNCGDPVIVKYVDKEETAGECNAFEVTYKYKVADQCGNYVWCKIAHTGEGGGDQLIGECPPDVAGLQCMDDVPTNMEVVELFKNAFENESMVRIWTKQQEGNDCDGFVVKYKVMINDDCGESVQCWITFSGKDETAPTGECPAGETGLSDLSQVPDPGALIGQIQNAYTDNCSDAVEVVFIDSETTDHGNCAGFKVVQTFQVSDECGNSTTCIITHTGEDGTGEITGTCPPTKDNLSCLAEVPTVEEVAARIKERFTGADGGEVSTTLMINESEGDECEGFVIKYKFKITDNCGNETSCWIRYSGKDEEPPVFTSELPNLIIGCEESPTFEAPDAEDNCGGEVTVEQIGEDMIIEGDCSASFSIVRTWIATDACGNISEPVSQIVTVPEECCTQQVCAYTPFYWGQNIDTGTPNVQEVLEANGNTIDIGGFSLDATCIDVVLPGAPLANSEELNANCPEGLFSSSLIRHTIALTLNTLNDPALCEVLLKDLPCPIDLAFFGYDETSTVCDLLADANEALSEEWFDCELADALASVNECFDCTICVPESEETEEEVSTRDEGQGNNNNTLIRTDLGQPSQTGLNLEVFPNPSGGMVNLQYAGFGQERVWIYVHHVNGDLVHKTQIQEGDAAQLTLDMAGLRLPGGTYVITASSKQATLSRKVIVNYQR